MTAAAKIRPVASPNPLARFWWVFRENPGAVVGLWVISAIVVAALLADAVAPHPPHEQYPRRLSDAAGLRAGRNMAIPPSAPTISDATSFHASSTAPGSPCSSAASSYRCPSRRGYCWDFSRGFTRGIVEIAIMRSMDIMLALPALLLAIVIVAVLGPGLTNAMYAIAIISLPHYVRLTRAAVIAERTKDYVIASRLAGAGVPRLAFITVLPNCLAPLIVQATLGFSTAVLDVAALGFLGLGAQPPTPEWGTMLADARQFMQRAWWVVTFPGLAILITVLSFNLLGDGLRDALDPRMRR